MNLSVSSMFNWRPGSAAPQRSFSSEPREDDLMGSTETLSMATMIDSLSGACGSAWGGGRPAGLAFSLPEEKPT
ncbi:hypothetical protein EYF80_054407 [Liparis tanakae]|uniref:Uncharacterized protein n=1 Tax=Liparis tanakae TaxID=230148 RepID=A0A4Z2F3H2_9TELE|nr:hypothetical protein EYF80_054407 [Liparis tanakae]